MEDYEDFGISGDEALDYILLTEGRENESTGCLAFILLPIIGGLFVL